MLLPFMLYILFPAVEDDNYRRTAIYMQVNLMLAVYIVSTPYLLQTGKHCICVVLWGFGKSKCCRLIIEMLHDLRRFFTFFGGINAVILYF